MKYEKPTVHSVCVEDVLSKLGPACGNKGSGKKGGKKGGGDEWWDD